MIVFRILVVPLTSIFLPLLLVLSTMALPSAKWKVSLYGLPAGASASNESMPWLSGGVTSTTPPSIRLIDWREWQSMRSESKSGGDAAEQGPMLIVAAERQEDGTETVPESELEELVQSTSPGASSSTASIPSLPPTTTATTTPTTVTTTTSAPSVMINSSDIAPSTSPTPGDDSVPLPPVDLRGLPIIVALLKQLTMLPVMIKSLTGEQSPSIYQRAESLDPTGGGPPPDPFRSLLSSNGGTEMEGFRNDLSPHIHPLTPRAEEDGEGDDGKEEKIFSFRRYASGVPTASGGEQLRESQPQPIIPAITTESGQLKMPKGKAPSGPSPSSSRHLTLSNNIYGLNDAGTTQHQPTNTYEAPRIPHKKPRPKFDFSALTVNEVEQLESIHKKLFNEETGDQLSPLPSPTFVPPLAPPAQISTLPPPRAIRQQFNSPGTLPTPIAGHAQLLAGMDAAALRDIAAVKDLPDLDEITRGMDLRLLNKPGGFAILKQQFIKRLAQRTLNGSIR